MNVEIILALLAVMLVFVAIAHKIGIPYPILLVIGGLGISLVPGLPTVALEPNIVFVLFLPPIIQFSAFNTPMRDFRKYANSIGFLAIGLVLASMVAVAIVAHWLIPEMPWAAAFVLGAIVAPPDAVAASTIARRLRLPRTIVTVLEGESLLNDATALVAYRAAVVAVMTGVFSFWEAGWQFVLNSVGGVAVGIAFCLIITIIFKRLRDNIPVYLTLTFLSGYGAYLIADALHVSGVLAVIALGLMYSIPRFNTMTPELRIQGTAIWDIVIFLLNGLVFILIGLQLRGILDRLPGASLLHGLEYAGILCLTLIVVRMLWMFPGAYLSWRFSSRRRHESSPSWQQVVIIGWTGMRGIITLASALALPLTTLNNEQFPQRDLIIFISFCVILVTLVLQGLSLPFLIRLLAVKGDGSEEREKNKARLRAAQTAHDLLCKSAEEKLIPLAFAEKLKHQYAAKVRLHSARYHGTVDSEQEEKSSQFLRLQRSLIETEIEELLRLRQIGIINDEVLREVQRDLDLEWLHLQDS